MANPDGMLVFMANRVQSLASKTSDRLLNSIEMSGSRKYDTCSVSQCEVYFVVRSHDFVPGMGAAFRLPRVTAP